MMHGQPEDPMQSGVNTEPLLMTAAEFLITYEPATLAIMHNPIKALREDTERAHALARELGKEVRKDGRYRPSIWAVVYR